jgi:hypothetical protein
MRVMAICAGHCSLGEPVSVRPLKLRPGADMATGALAVYPRWLGGHERRCVSVNRMAAAAGHLPFRVPALDPARMSRFVQVACKAELIRLRRAEFYRVSNVFRRSGLSVFARGTMTRFAGLSHPSKLLSGPNHVVRRFCKGRENVLMAGLADLRPDVLRRRRGRFYRLLSSRKQGRAAECGGRGHRPA